MPQRVIANLVESKVLANGQEVEDVKKITLPDIKKLETEIDAMGMVAKLNIADPTHYEAMSCTIEHNRGRNFERLRDVGVIELEARNVVQQYTLAQSEMGYRSEKIRMRLQHKATTGGDQERNNPISSSEEYSVLRYEEVVEGKTITLIDALAGVVTINGVSMTDPIKALLD